METCKSREMDIIVMGVLNCLKINRKFWEGSIAWIYHFLYRFRVDRGYEDNVYKSLIVETFTFGTRFPPKSLRPKSFRPCESVRFFFRFFSSQKMRIESSRRQRRTSSYPNTYTWWSHRSRRSHTENQSYMYIRWYRSYICSLWVSPLEKGSLYDNGVFIFPWFCITNGFSVAYRSGTRYVKG